MNADNFVVHCIMILRLSNLKIAVLPGFLLDVRVCPKIYASILYRYADFF